VGKAALYAHVWPNLMLNRYGPWCDINIVYPVRNTHTHTAVDWFASSSVVLLLWPLLLAHGPDGLLLE
jgi:hypothetical protein